ncbi:MAG: hypothetical protein WB975_05055 [Nitrososphaeraceae archaeon]
MYTYEKVLLINLFFWVEFHIVVVVLQEDEENMNGNNIQEVMEEVEETAEEASTSGPENMNENEEVDGIDVEFNTDATTMEVDLAVRRNDVLKRIIKEKYHPSNEDKIILRLQEQLNKHFQSSKRTEDVLKQIQRKLVQVEKFAVISNKQHESIRKMQYQFNDIQRTITKLDKSITILRSKGSANSNSRLKLGKNSIKYKKGKNSTKKGHGTRK